MNQNVLPKSANLVSYFVLTSVMCVITYALVLNLQHLKDLISLARSNVHGMLHRRNFRRTRQEVGSDNARADGSTAKRASIMA